MLQTVLNKSIFDKKNAEKKTSLAGNQLLKTIEILENFKQ